MSAEATVFVVDDDQDLCQALRWLLESDGLKVETYTSAQAFLAAYDPDRPGVLLLDVRMRGMNALELQQHLNDRGVGIPIIILTGRGVVPMAVRALKGGAVGFLQKPVKDQVLLDQIHAAIELDAERCRRQTTRATLLARLQRLTPRERQVMNLVVCGKSNKSIARELNVSEKTVELHRRRVMRKMGAGSAVELVRAVLTLEHQQPAPSA